MKVYVDFKDLDAEDMPSNISNKYDLQVRSINGGSDYKNVELVSLADYDKQVRKELVQEIKKQVIQSTCYDTEEEVRNVIYDLNASSVLEILNQLQGEDNGN